MRIGILARSEDRGLGILTWEAARHIPDAYALVVDPGKWGKGFPLHLNRYVDEVYGFGVVRWDDDQRFASPEIVQAWLRAMDVVLIAETAYDARLYEWARDAGTATVLYVMPELANRDQIAQADAVWVPTPWRLDEIPGARVVPFPVATERFAERPAVVCHPPRILHVAGHAAYQDRNGTKLVAAATSLIDGAVTVSSQDVSVAVHSQATLRAATDWYWRNYEHFDVLLMPRRFGGLCLPIQEAKAAGLAVVALDTAPHDWYGCVPIPAEAYSSFGTSCGEVSVFNARPEDVADAVNSLSLGDLRDLSDSSLVWAAEHSWSALLPLWMDEFEKVLANRT